MGEAPPVWNGLPKPPDNRLLRTVPTWMDPRGEFGDIQFLRLRPSGKTKLPKNPFLVSTTVEKLVGKIDGGNPVDGGENYLLRVRNPAQVNALLKLDKLIDGTPINIEYHPTLNLVQCVVSCDHVEGMKDEDLQAFLADQGVVKVYRFLKKSGERTIPTNSMVLTIKGTVRPRHIFFGFIRTETRPYYPRPLMCYLCGKYGHTKKRCSSSPICLECGGPGPHEDCSNPSHCINCGGDHSAISRQCPIHQQEQTIVRLKVDRGISQSEATRIFRNHLANQEEVVRRSQAITTEAEKDKKIQELEGLVSQLMKELANYKQSGEESTLVDNSTTTQESDDSEPDTARQTMTPRPPNFTSTPKRNRQDSSLESPPAATITLTKKKKPITQGKPPHPQNPNR